MSRQAKPINWLKYPVRCCRWMNECRICEERIRDGELYYDGGYGRRAHVGCVGTMNDRDAQIPEQP